MILDSEDQRRVLVKCIHAAAAGLQNDASDQHLANLAVLVRTRQEVESAVIAGVAEPPPAPA